MMIRMLAWFEIFAYHDIISGLMAFTQCCVRGRVDVEVRKLRNCCGGVDSHLQISVVVHLDLHRKEKG